MQPIQTIIHTDCDTFTSHCHDIINQGYILSSSNCSCNGQCSDEVYQAIFVLPQHNKSSMVEKEVKVLRKVEFCDKGFYSTIDSEDNPKGIRYGFFHGFYVEGTQEDGLELFGFIENELDGTIMQRSTNQIKFLSTDSTDEFDIEKLEVIQTEMDSKEL